MAVKTWNAVSGGNWGVAESWNPSLPEPLDEVLINRDGDYTVVLDVNAAVAGLTLGGATGIQSLLINGPTFSLSGSGTVNSTGVINLNLGTFSGNSNLTIQGVFNWGGGAHSGVGTTAITGNLNLISGNRRDLSGRTLQTSGTTTWAGSDFLALSNGAVWNNSGTILLQSNADLVQWDQTVPIVNHTGTLIKTSGSNDDPSRWDAIFNNTGTVEVQQGRLFLNRGGTSSGQFLVAEGAVLEFGGSHRLTETATLAGAGIKRFSGIGGVSTLEMGGSIPGTIEVAGGIVNLNGTAFTLDQLELLAPNAELSGNSNLTIQGVFNWGGGAHSGVGTTAITGNLNLISGSRRDLSGRTLQTSGTTTWAGSDFLALSNGAVWNNSGTILLQSNADLVQWDQTVPIVNHTGTLIKTFGNNDDPSQWDAIFNNTGTVEVQQGRLFLNRGGTSSGQFLVAEGAVLEFGGSHRLTETATLAGAGTKRFSGIGGVSTLEMGGGIPGTIEIISGTVNVDRNSTFDNLVLSGGVLGGTGTVTASTVVWSGSRHADAGMTSITNILNLVGSGDINLDTRSLQTDGSTVWTHSGRFFFSNGAIWNNTGAMELRSDADWFWTSGNLPSFNNTGSFTKFEGSSSDATEIRIAFINAGTVEVQQGNLDFRRGYVQTAGITRLNGGNFLSSTPIEIRAGTLTGTGTITGSVVNAGSLNPGISSGILNLTENYTQTSTGSLNLELGGAIAGTTFDQLNVTGTANLAGTLNLSLTNGFLPQVGDRFQVLTYGSVNGGLTLNGLQLNNGLAFLPTSTGQNLILEATDQLVNLGRLTTSNPKNVLEFIGNPDPIDYYHFNVSTASSLSLNLRGLTANADVSLIEPI